ncbi:MAG TPA: glycosyltransferase [Candidatus Methanoperedens sp.]|nr:glycosyltransferase [Candidatus Methanoperedens sp.]
MKIAYVLETFPKLSESFILNEIVELLKNGHDIRIFSIYLPVEDIKHEVINEYNILERTHYFSFNRIFKVNLIILLKYFLMGVVQDLCNLKISINIFALDLKLAYFATIMHKNHMELIHAHFASMGNISRRLGKILGLPYTLTAHAFDIYMDPDEDKLRKVMENAHSVVTISDYNKNHLQGKIGIVNRIEVIRCGIDIDRFSPRRKLEIDDGIKLLTVTRLVEKKGLEYLIRAIPIVIKQMPGFDLTIVGSGPLNDHLHQLVHDLKLEGYIQFKGDLSDFELMHYYENAEMFILPCIIAENGDRDGIPVAIMEAMAMELPVISTTVSGIPELVDDGISGILVSQKDEKAIANAIIKLHQDKKLRLEMGENGRKIIENKYNIVSESEKLIKIFNKMRC